MTTATTSCRHRVLCRVVAIEDDRAYCVIVLLGYPRVAWALPLSTLGPRARVGFRFYCRVTLPSPHFEAPEIEDFEPGDFELEHDQRVPGDPPTNATGILHGADLLSTRIADKLRTWITFPEAHLGLARLLTAANRLADTSEARVADRRAAVNEYREERRRIIRGLGLTEDDVAN